MSSNPGGSGVVEHLKKMLGEPLFCWGVGLGLAIPLGQFPPNFAVGHYWLVFGYYMPVTCRYWGGDAQITIDLLMPKYGHERKAGKPLKRDRKASFPTRMFSRRWA